MGMRRWMGSHFHDWIDYNGLHFYWSYYSGVAHFWDFWETKILVSRDLKVGRFTVKKCMVRAVVLILDSRLALNSVLEITT